MPIMNLIANIINLAVVVTAAVAFFNASRHSTQAFEAVGRGSKVIWLVGLGFATVAVFIYGMTSLPGLLATVGAIVYHVDQKPKLIEIVRPRW